MDEEPLILAEDDQEYLLRHKEVLDKDGRDKPRETNRTPNLLNSLKRMGLNSSGVCILI